MELEAEKLNTENVNKPESGTYGDGVRIDDLKRALPQPPQQIPQSSGPQPPPGASTPGVARALPPRPPGGPPGGTPTPPGIPGALARPSNTPTPIGAYGGPQQMAQVSSRENRLRILDIMANDEGASEATREWAQRVRRILSGNY